MTDRSGPYRRDNNSTNYVHPNEENLFNLHKAMEYDAEGKPVLRVRVDGGQITISGDVVVDEVGLTASTLAALETTTVLQGTDPWIIGDGGGSISIDDGGNVITVDGTVSATVSGTVSVSNFPATQTVDGTVGLDAATLAALENITVTVDNEISINDGGNSITVDGTVTALQGTDPWTVDGTVNIGTLPEVEVKNDVGNPLPVNILEGGVAVDGNNALPTRQLNDDGLIAYARGGAVTETDVLNSYLIDKSGATETLGTSAATMVTVWDEGGLYPWNTFTGSGAHIFVASDSDDAKMRGVAITIEGLDSNYSLISEVVTMDSSDTTTVKETTQNFYRVVKATVTGTNTNGIPNDYDISFKYGSSGGTVVAKILATYGATQSCTYTVPAGYQGFILGVNGSSGQSDEITTMIWQRPFNSAWSQIKTFKFVSGTFEHNMRTPLVFNEKTDIEIRAYALVESSRIGTEFQLLLVPNVA